jgi:uncharacterized protein
VSAEAVVRTLYTKVGEGNFEGVLSLLADDAVFVQATSLPFGGEWRGKTGFTEMARRIVSAWPGFAATPRAFFANGQDQVAVLASLNGEALDMDMIELWTVVGDRIARCQPFYFDAAAAARTAKDQKS